MLGTRPAKRTFLIGKKKIFKMEKGEIWLTNLPQQVGKEQIGKRPALIVADTKTSLMIVIPLTANLETSKYFNVVKVEPSSQNGLDKISMALLFQMRAIDRKRLIHKLGILENFKMNEIDGKLRELLRL